MTTPSDSATAAQTSDTIRAALDEAATAVDAAQTLLRQGNIVDLRGLEDHVEMACGSIADLPQAGRDQLKPTLLALIDSLNTLTNDLNEQHAEISATLQGVGHRRKALSAYRPPSKR